MHRALPVGNKVCAARVKNRYEDQRQQRLRDMRPQVDTSKPKVTGYAHLKKNWKRDEALAQRHDVIDRDNRHLLNRMVDHVNVTAQSIKKVRSTPNIHRVPGGPARQREDQRIREENMALLRRLETARPEYNRATWEDSYSRTGEYMKIKCEYPPLLRRSTSSSSLFQLPSASHGPPTGRSQEDPAAFAAGPHDEEDVVEEEFGVLRFVLREQRMIGDEPYLVEMSTDGCELAISAYDTETQQTAEMLVSEENHRNLLAESNGDYKTIADRLRIMDGNALVLMPPHQAAEPASEGEDTAGAGPAAATEEGDGGPPHEDAAGAGPPPPPEEGEGGWHGEAGPEASADPEADMLDADDMVVAPDSRQGAPRRTAPGDSVMEDF